MSTLFDDLKEGLQEAIDYEKGVGKANDATGTLARRKKKSFDWYKQVIASNGEKL